MEQNRPPTIKHEHIGEQKWTDNYYWFDCASLSLLGFELGSQARNLEPRGEGRLGELKQAPLARESTVSFEEKGDSRRLPTLAKNVASLRAEAPA